MNLLSIIWVLSYSELSIWSQGHLTPFDQNYKGGLQYVQFDDNSYVAVWEEVQDRSNLGIGYQRFDSEGNPFHHN